MASQLIYTTSSLLWPIPTNAFPYLYEGKPAENKAALLRLRAPDLMRELRALASKSFGARPPNKIINNKRDFLPDLHVRKHANCNMVKPIERLVSLG
jgi:hypothetical protein